MPDPLIEELGDSECRTLLAGRYLRVTPVSLTGRRIRIPDELPFTRWG